MKKNIRYLFLIISIASIDLHAETSSLKTELMIKETRAAIDADNYISILDSISSICESDDYFSEKSDLTIYQRSERLKEIEACIASVNAAASISALEKNSLNEKLAIEAALAPETSKLKKEIKENSSETEFMGLNWGLGFGYSFSDDEAIDDAEIVDGVVRVKSNKKDQPRVVLEFHKYLWCNNKAKDGTRGCGPFVAVAATQDDILSGVGVISIIKC